MDRRRWDADARSRLGGPWGRAAVVLVHGLVVSARYMIPAMKQLALRHRVYAPDLPGFGKSGKPARVPGVPGLSDALARWMRKLGLERTALVGNSMGCQIIAELAVRHPDLVERVVLQGPTMDPLARSTLRQIGRLLLDARWSLPPSCPSRCATTCLWVRARPGAPSGTPSPTVSKRNCPA